MTNGFFFVLYILTLIFWHWLCITHLIVFQMLDHLSAACSTLCGAINIKLEWAAKLISQLYRYFLRTFWSFLTLQEVKFYCSDFTHLLLLPNMQDNVRMWRNLDTSSYFKSWKGAVKRTSIQITLIGRQTGGEAGGSDSQLRWIHSAFTQIRPVQPMSDYMWSMWGALFIKTSFKQHVRLIFSSFTLLTVDSVRACGWVWVNEQIFCHH